MKNQTSNAIITDLENAEDIKFGKRDQKAFESLKANIDKGMAKASDAYVTIGCALWQIHHGEYYRIENYKNIAEFALDVYELKKATTHNYIKVIEKFGEIVAGKAIGLKEKYKPFMCSQLVNMTSLTPEQLEQVTPDWSVRQIIEFGKASSVIETDEDGESIIDANGEDAEKIGIQDINDRMPVPELEAGRTTLAICNSFDELIQNRTAYENAFNDMKHDNNFAKKKIRFVLELAYD